MSGKKEEIKKEREKQMATTRRVDGRYHNAK
jgi:hypothetical protein